MPSLTHQNLPLSIFLETPDLGYPAWGGTTSGKVSDSDILSALGIGIVSYKDVPEAELQAPDYTYRVDTDVITSITLTSSAEVNPDDPASVTFHINGGTYTVNDIVALVNKNWKLKLYFFAYNLQLLYCCICFPVLFWCQISQCVCWPFLVEIFYICLHLFWNVFALQMKICKQF